MQDILGQKEMIFVHTEVRRHPERWEYAVFAVVKTPLGSYLYCSAKVFAFEESARRHQKEVIDDRLDSVLHREAETRDPDVFRAVEGISELVRQPTRWAPGQFDAIT